MLPQIICQKSVSLSRLKATPILKLRLFPRMPCPPYAEDIIPPHIIIMRLNNLLLHTQHLSTLLFSRTRRSCSAHASYVPRNSAYFRLEGHDLRAVFQWWHKQERSCTPGLDALRFQMRCGGNFQDGHLVNSGYSLCFSYRYGHSFLGTPPELQLPNGEIGTCGNSALDLLQSKLPGI